MVFLVAQGLSEWCITGGKWGETNENDIVGDIFKGIVPSWKSWLNKIRLLLLHFLSLWGSQQGLPLRWWLGDIPSQVGDRVAWIRGTYKVKSFGWLFCSSPMIKPTEQDLVKLMVFLVPLGLWNDYRGWQMGDSPSQEKDGEGQIRKTRQVIDLRWLFPPLPMKKPAILQLVFLVAKGPCEGTCGWWTADVTWQEGDEVRQIWMT